MFGRKLKADNFKKKFYEGRDPRDLPLYEVSEAARYLRISYFILYSWLRPFRFASPHGSDVGTLIRRPEGCKQLSFNNLIEAHVLKGLRLNHQMPTGEILESIRYAEKELGIENLLTKEFKAGAKQMFVEHMGELISLGRGGQFSMGKMLDKYLQRITYENSVAASLNPFVSESAERYIEISPEISFGKPVVASAGIETRVIADRFELGEENTDIAEDYGITEAEVEEAILYESKQAA